MSPLFVSLVEIQGRENKKQIEHLTLITQVEPILTKIDFGYFCLLFFIRYVNVSP